jgi:hypothetical protein
LKDEAVGRELHTRARHLTLNLMGTSEEKPRVEVRIAPLSGRELATEIAGGVGRALGLTLFWGLEIVRDSYFRLLDRLNVRPRRKRASAFPPGQPKKRSSAPTR